MPQNPIPTTIATNPSHVQTPLAVDALGQCEVTTTANLQRSANLSAATSLFQGPGLVAGVNNENAVNLLPTAAMTTTQIAALTTSTIGVLYDVSLAPGLLTTTQVAALTTTQIAALTPQTIAALTMAVPVTNGLAFVPGTGQVANITYEKL